MKKICQRVFCCILPLRSEFYEYYGNVWKDHAYFGNPFVCNALAVFFTWITFTVFP